MIVCISDSIDTFKMTTGDLKNNLRKLQSELKAVNYTRDVDFERFIFVICSEFVR